MHSVSETKEVVIIGAGIGGLTAAMGLLKAGVDVTVYERASELAEIGAGVQVSANASRVLFHLGIGESLASTNGLSISKELRLWNSDRAWAVADTGDGSRERYGAPFLTLHRRDLLDALVAGVRSFKPDAIVLGHKCTGISQNGNDALVTFQNGEFVRARCVIGADGIHSAVRNAAFGKDDPKFTGCIAWRGLIPMEKLPEENRPKVSANWMGPGRHVITYPLRGGTILNFVGILGNSEWAVESWTEKGSVQECLSDFSGWHEDVRRLIQNIEQPFKWALMSRKPMTAWANDRVGLMGDACHPTLPFLGSGAGMAIEDGAVLARCVAKYAPDFVKALKHFETARLQRTTSIVDRSTAMLDHFQGGHMNSAVEAEAFVNREWTPERVRERYDWIYSYDPYSVPI